MTPPTLETIRRDLASKDQGTRGKAMEALLSLARTDESIHPEALGVFVAVVARPPDAQSALAAARGVALLAGEREGRRAWRSLLNNDMAEIVNAAAQVVDYPYEDDLVALLARWNERMPLSAIMNALGRLKCAAAFQPIADRLTHKDEIIRANAVVALGLLGDKRAVPLIEKLATDTANAWRADNHGPMMRVGDVAKETLVKLGVPQTKAPQAAPPKAAPPQAQAAAKPARKANALSYLPLLAAMIEIPWIGAVLFTQLFTTGGITHRASETQRLDLIAMAPAALGLAAALIALLRGGPRNATEAICFVLGLGLCGLFAFSFGWEFFHPR